MKKKTKKSNKQNKIVKKLKQVNNKKDGWTDQDLYDAANSIGCSLFITGP